MEKLLSQEELAKLPLDALYIMKQQIDHDVNFLQQSLNTLKIAQEKFADSGKNILKVKHSNILRMENSLIPLTESMFVKGEIINNDKFLVNIGTGYYLRMTSEKAAAYFKRRHDYVTQQLEIVQKLFNEKDLTASLLTIIIQEKMKFLKKSTMSEQTDVEGSPTESNSKQDPTALFASTMPTSEGDLNNDNDAMII